MFNSGGYESVETLKRLDGLVDIYLPDFKFLNPTLSKLLAGASDYSEICTLALKEMHRQTGRPVWNEEKLEKGIIIRHLILPGQTKDSIFILDKIHSLFSKSGVVLSLLRQYTPCHKAKNIKGLDRKLTTLEYQKVLSHAEKIGFSYLFTQERSSAEEEFIPDFTVFSDEKN